MGWGVGVPERGCLEEHPEEIQDYGDEEVGQQELNVVFIEVT